MKYETKEVELNLEGHEIFNGLKCYQNIRSPIYPGLSILIMTEDFEVDSNIVVIRLYLLKHYKDELEFNVEAELEAFSFVSFESARMFLDKFPSLSALDLLILQNPIKNDQMGH